MTERTIVECDWNGCDMTAQKLADRAPEEWGVLDDGEHSYDLCPLHFHRTNRWAMAGVSEGRDFDTVKHEHVDSTAEEYVYAHGGTHSMRVGRLLDEPPARFPFYDPEEHEGWHFHAHDHAALTIIGHHKDGPLVVMEPEEHRTRYQVRQSGSGYSFDRLWVEEGIEVERFEPEVEER